MWISIKSDRSLSLLIPDKCKKENLNKENVLTAKFKRMVKVTTATQDFKKLGGGMKKSHEFHWLSKGELENS